MSVERTDCDGSTTVESKPPESLDRLVPLLYNELRAVARRQLRARKDGNRSPTLDTTALVNEAYLKLVDQSHATWHDRAHFVAVAAIAMRHILVDRARARLASKREGHRRRVSFDEDTILLDDQAAAVLEIDDALRRLETQHPRLANVVICRFFGGLSEAETAELLGVTIRTVQRDWVKARDLLRHALAN
ncbi:MAG TPA: ECF-type sigma factor [Gemmatimonadaceae bacterium]|nr:ECF-type sigma factor [Gemmatimonadaceae bacterium]